MLSPVRFQMLRSGFPACLLTTLLFFGPACQSTGSDPGSEPPETSVQRPQGKIRLLLNSDGGSGSLYAHEPPITLQQVCRVLDELEDTQVDVFIQCISYGSFVAYGTKVGEVYGKGMTEFKNPNFRRWAQNVLGLLEKATDPLDIWASRAHELGMQFWPSMRMNDIHKDWVDRWPSLRTKWELERPHVRIGEGVPDRYVSRYDRRFSWAFDFAQKDVRDLKFALIEEICQNYDVDGFEMDFLSHPMYFKKGQEQHGMAILTGFLRRIRQRMDEIGKEKGRKLTLMVRVLPRIDLCEEIGIDVRTWIKEGVVDMVAPATRGYLDMTPDLSSFVELAKGTQVEISGGISDLYVRDYTGSKTGRGSIEMMRAAAQSFWGQGVTSLHLFNYDAHATGIQHHNTVASLIDTSQNRLFNPEEFRILQEIGDPEIISRRNKHYYITRDMEARLPEEGGEMQLPISLLERDQKSLHLFVGDALESARSDGMLKSLKLAVTLAGYSRWDDDLRVQLNGTRLRGKLTGGRLLFEDVPAQQGKNELTLSLTRRSPNRNQPVRVQAVELLVEYESRVAG